MHKSDFLNKMAFGTYNDKFENPRTSSDWLSRDEAAVDLYNEDPLCGFVPTAGLLHDIDFERWPEEHCRKAPELLEKGGCSPELIHAVCSHGYGICCDVEPVHEMEKVLFAADELTGLIGAAARMRPSKSVQDMELSSLKKKFKDKKFAAGCSRDVIRTGAERLGWELDTLLERTIEAMRSCEEGIQQEMARLGLA